VALTSGETLKWGWPGAHPCAGYIYASSSLVVIPSVGEESLSPRTPSLRMIVSEEGAGGWTTDLRVTRCR